MSRFAEPGFKCQGVHEGLIILLPDGPSSRVSSDHNAFHVVGSDTFRDAHVGEGMNHPDEEVFLSCVREELHVPFAAVVADHGETRRTELVTFWSDHVCEPPVHLGMSSTFS